MLFLEKNQPFLKIINVNNKSNYFTVFLVSYCILRFFYRYYFFFIIINVNSFWELLYFQTSNFHWSFFFVLFLFTISGYLHDSSLIWLNIVKIESYSYLYLSLWIVFISYYGDLFNYLKSLPTIILSILGGLGGALAYWSAFQL